MGLRIHWSERARNSLRDLLGFIGVENRDAAQKLWLRIQESLIHAGDHPEMYRYLPELGHTYREIVSVRPFRVLYRIEEKELRIVAVLRSEQPFDPSRFLETP